MNNFSYKTAFNHITQNGHGWTYTYYTDETKLIRFSEISRNSSFGHLSEGRLFYPTGQVKATFRLNHVDQLYGQYTEVYEDGSTKIVATYIGGLLQGYLTTFYEGTRQIHEISQFANNKRNGPHKEYYINGHLKLETCFRDDVPVGIFKVKYDNDKNSQMIVCSFTHNGVIDGEFKVFSENEEPQITMYFTSKGECTNKVELTDFTMSEICKEFFDHLIQFNDVNKAALKTDTHNFDKVWDNVLDVHEDAPKLLDSKPHVDDAWKNSNQSGYLSGYQSGYQSGSYQSNYSNSSVYQPGYTVHSDYLKNLAANRETEYETQLAKAIEESRTQTDNTAVATVSFRSLIDTHREEQTAIHDAKKEQDPLGYLKEMCMPWYAIEQKILAGQ